MALAAPAPQHMPGTDPQRPPHEASGGWGKPGLRGSAAREPTSHSTIPTYAVLAFELRAPLH
jgi:hypothetical protein